MSKKLFLAALASLALASQSHAAPGDLDPTFGTGGLITYNTGLNTDDVAKAVTVLPDGKILVAGNTYLGRKIIRYLPSGIPDPGFGTMGIVFVPSALGYIRAMAVDPTGWIVLAHDCEPVGLKEICVSRYTETGAPDTTFGADTATPGSVHTGFGSGANSYATSLVIDQEGRIVVGGYTHVNPIPTTYEKKFALARYLINGQLDTTFVSAGPGLVTTDIPSSTAEQINVLAIDGEGRILAVGESNAGTSLPKLAIVRYLPNGNLDLAFDGDGIVENSSVREGHSIALQNDGKIVVGGMLALGRYHENGSLDLANFGGGDGIATLSPSWPVMGLAIQPDGKILAAGHVSSSPTGENLDFVVARFTAMGAPDTSYGEGGKRQYDFGGEDNAVNAAAFLPDGRVAVVGYTRESESTTTPKKRNWAIARYLGESADVAITMTDSPDPVTVGETLTYNLTVTNNGPDLANTVNLTSTLPTGVTMISATPSQGSCSGTTTVTCDLGSLTSGTSANITLAVTAPGEAGTLVNTAAASGFYFDANSANHQLQESTAVTLAVAEAVTAPAAETPPTGPVTTPAAGTPPTGPEEVAATGGETIIEAGGEPTTTAPAKTGGGGGCTLMGTRNAKNS